MASIRGVAGGAAELWTILLDFVTANGWEIIDQAERTVDVETSIKCVQLRGEDISGEGHIYVHLIYRAQTTQDIFAFEIEGSAGWLPGSDVTQFGQNPQNSYRDVGTTTSVIVRAPLHRNPIEYWLTCSPRRFMGAFRHNDRWGSMYCGFIKPYGLPSQWPYPLLVAGNNITTNDYKTNTNGCAFGASAVISGMIYLPDGKWYSYPVPNTGPGGGRGAGLGAWPWNIAPSATAITYRKPLVDKNGAEIYTMLPHILYSLNSANYGTYGELDGLYQVTAWGASGGDILKWNGREYLLLQREMSTANGTAAAMILE